MHHQRSKHVDIQYHYVRKHAEDNEINLTYVPTADVVADTSTKTLGAIKFKILLQQLGTLKPISGHRESQARLATRCYEFGSHQHCQ